MQLRKLQMYINGAYVDPSSENWLESYDPYKGKPWALIPRGNEDDANHGVEAAYKAFRSGVWPSLTPSERGSLLRNVGDLVALNADRLANIEVKDNGKLMAEMSAQCNYLPQWFYYYGGLADKIEGSVIPIDKPDMFNFTRYEPLGPVVGITPWNSPLLTTVWKLAPALAAGNTFVLKPSSHTSASALELVKLFEKAGFPPGVFNVVTGTGTEVGEALVSHPKVSKIAFTGSEWVGQHINEMAAKNFTNVTLELGGKSPNIVFEDADLDAAVDGVISGIFAATGQTCVAGSRLVLQDAIHDIFMEKFLTLAKTARMGDPSNMDTQVGPVTTRAQYRKILKYIDIAKGEGAKCVMGGGPAERPECGDGWFIEPTVFTNVTNNMRIAQQEVFGPVLSVIRFEDEEEAVHIANDIKFGLAAGVWTQNIGRAFRISECLQAGIVWVNTYRAVSYLSPFGGYKRSGMGRENGIEGIRNYMQVKSTWINSGESVSNPFVLR